MTIRLCAYPTCGRPFRSHRSTQRYCSRSCASRDPGRWLPTRPPRLVMRVCEYDGCARPFQQKRPEQRYCSPSCAAHGPKRRVRATPRTRLCEYDACRKQYVVRRQQQRFCSQPCASRAHGIWGQGGYAAREITCPCGVVFSRKWVKPWSTYCSHQCFRRFTGFGGSPLRVAR